MKNYKTYHSIVKELARQDNLPYKYSSCIDRTTIWRWKKESDTKYFGHELSTVDLLEQFLNQPQSETVIKSYLRIAYSISRILIQTRHIQRALLENKEKLVRTIIRYKKHICLSIILRLCGISPSVFYHWKNQILNKCTSSPLKLCRINYPNQLIQTEVDCIKKLLTDPIFRYWPINSIAYYALRNNLATASLSSWYNYANKLGLNQPRFPKKNKY